MDSPVSEARLAAKGRITDEGLDEELAALEDPRKAAKRELLISFEELRARLAELVETRGTAERELAALRDKTDRIEELERDAEAILESYARMIPKALDALTPEERHRFYKMLGLKATVGADGSVELDGTFMADGPPDVGGTLGGAEGERAPNSTKTADKQKSAYTGARS